MGGAAGERRVARVRMEDSGVAPWSKDGRFPSDGRRQGGVASRSWTSPDFAHGELPPDSKNAVFDVAA
jgi:hypothetical protein